MQVRPLPPLSVGISGVQPKVLVPEQRGTLTLPNLIVKSGNAEYPNIAINEYVCMSIARAAGMRTPEFWISEDQQLFVTRRFDVLPSGERVAMEDFSVLMGKPGERKYQGRYETLLRAANLYSLDITEMFEQIALSLAVGNGDAHLKNFAIVYSDISGPFRLSPVFDVVSTRAYGDQTTALSIDGSRHYPARTYLEKLAENFGVREPKHILDRIGEAVGMVCHEFAETLDQLGARQIHSSLIASRDQVLR